MGASEGRKAKRKLQSSSDGFVKERVSSEDGSGKKHKRNRGRSEYRNVTRTARRPTQEEDVAEDEDDEVESEDIDDADIENQEEISKGEAYNALLNLLTAEQEEEEEEEGEEEKGEKGEAKAEDSDESEEEEEGHIAGVVEGESEDEEEEDEEIEEDSDNDESDPFEDHFANSSEEYLQKSIESLSTSKWKNVKKSIDHYSIIESVPPIESSKKYLNISNDHSLTNYNIKQKFLENFYNEFDGENFTKDNEICSKILDPMFSYQDILFPYESFTKIEDYRTLYILHAINHINRTTSKILKNNNRLHIQSEKIAKGLIKPNEEIEYRDQGFTRPKILILLPSRNQCFKVIENLIKMTGSEQVDNYKRFKKEFYSETIVPESKPDDFKYIFEGDSNDFFCLGVKLLRKSVKLYSSFYNADIIIASPIGLQLILENPNKEKRQNDFLSSIEILIIDQANSIEFQNWDHVLTILKYINKIPEEFHDTDFSRVRMWSIEDQAKFFTQSLIFTEFNTPNINNLITRSKNIFGKNRFKQNISNKDCSLFKIGLKIKQIFTRFESTSPINEPDERFKYFKSVIIPLLSKSTSYEDGLLIYIPSYTDFLRINNYLKERTSLSFSDINEYSTKSQLGRSRALFQQGRSKILLYTERLHYYRRYELKGVKNVLMYGVPTNPNFYTEIVSLIGKSVFEEIADFDISTVRCLYSKWDAMALERIVGTERAPVLTHGQNEFYEFR